MRKDVEQELRFAARANHVSIPGEYLRLVFLEIDSMRAEIEGARKRLADAERGLELLAKVRAHPHLPAIVDRLRKEAKSWRNDATMFATVRSPDEFAYASSRADLNEAVAELLSPGDANGGGDAG